MTAERLPAGTDALIAGGGFPEVYAAELAANAGLRAEVRSRAAAGLPVIAECGGLLWLGSALDGREQCGVLPAAGRMTGRLTLGYREAVALHDSPLAAAGPWCGRTSSTARSASRPTACRQPGGSATAAARAGLRPGCWPPTCTCTGLACRARRPAWSPPREPREPRVRPGASRAITPPRRSPGAARRTARASPWTAAVPRRARRSADCAGRAAGRAGRAGGGGGRADGTARAGRRHRRGDRGADRRRPRRRRPDHGARLACPAGRGRRGRRPARRIPA